MTMTVLLVPSAHHTLKALISFSPLPVVVVGDQRPPEVVLVESALAGAALDPIDPVRHHITRFLAPEPGPLRYAPQGLAARLTPTAPTAHARALEADDGSEAAADLSARFAALALDRALDDLMTSAFPSLAPPHTCLASASGQGSGADAPVQAPPIHHAPARRPAIEIRAHVRLIAPRSRVTGFALAHPRSLGGEL